MDAQLKSDRIEARIRPEAKELIEHAAALLGMSVSSFLVEAVQARATEVIRDHQSMQLSVRDSEAFIAALLGTAGPNAALERALSRHKREVDS